MRGSLQKDFSVFDFDEDEGAVEAVSAEKVRRCFPAGNPNLDKSAVTKYDFLRAFQGGNASEEEISNVFCMDIDSSNELKKSGRLGSFPVKLSQKDFAYQEEAAAVGNFVEAKNDMVHPLTAKSLEAEFLEEPGVCPDGQSESRKEFGCTLPVMCPNHMKEVDAISDNETLVSRSPSSSDYEGNGGCVEISASNICNEDYMEMEMNMEVCISPDYLMYGDKIYIHPCLTFLSDRIKLEGEEQSGDGDTFSSEWALDDVVHIECQWSELVEIASVKLLLRPTLSGSFENGHGPSGILKLAFAVGDHLWFEKEQKITALASKYKAVWNVPDPQLAKELTDFMGQNNMFIMQHYFSDYDGPYEDVVYPKGDPDAVSISKRDVKLLEPDTFVNDTIIDFYIKYLKNKVQPDKVQRFHFFNSFFFRKLADLDKDPGSASEGRAAFLRVRKWTRKVNLFEKDYIFIPVNFNLHWSLIVICHPGEVAHFQDLKDKDYPKIPCILHMDSIRGSHRGVKNLIQSYLWEEWKERHGKSSEEFGLSFSNLKFVSLELPQQENSYDCGLFLLHYVELFLEEAPANFNPFKITESSNFLTMKWFPPAEASLKRSIIRRLLWDILNDSILKGTEAGCCDDDMEEHASELLSEQCTQSVKASLSSSLNPVHENGGNEELRISLPFNGAECNDDKGTSILQAVFVHESQTRKEPADHCELFRQLSFCPSAKAAMEVSTKEDGETSKQLVCRASDNGAYQPPGELVTGIPAASSSSKGVEAVEVQLSAVSASKSLAPPSTEMLIEDNETREQSSSATLISSKNIEHKIIKMPQTNNQASPDAHEDFEKLQALSPNTNEPVEHNPSLPSTGKFDTCVVEDSDSDSPESDTLPQIKKKGSSLSCPEVDIKSSNQYIESCEDSDFVCDVEQMDVNNLETRSPARQICKRRKLASFDGGRRQTRSLVKD